MPVRKISIALDPANADEAAADAARRGESLSAWINEAISARVRRERGLGAVAAWEAEHGALTPPEKRRARATLTRALAKADRAYGRKRSALPKRRAS
jgi:hypothetical protein